MRDAKTRLLRRMVQQSNAAVACCGELGNIARGLTTTLARLSEIPDENFTADELEFVKECGRRITVMSAAVNAASEGSK